MTGRAPIILGVIALAAVFVLAGCASGRDTMDSRSYERAVEKQFNENYQERLSY